MERAVGKNEKLESFKLESRKLESLPEVGESQAKYHFDTMILDTIIHDNLKSIDDQETCSETWST